MRKIFLIVLIILFTTNSFSASFDCEKANSEVEKKICSDQNISSLDKWMSNSYKSHYKYKSDDEREKYRSKQLKWLKHRDNTCAKAKSMGACLEKEYKKRIEEIRKNNRYLRDDMDKKAPYLLELLVNSHKFDIIKTPPEYFILSKSEYIVAIGWGQGGRMQLGFYLVSTDSNTIEKIVGGYPRFDGIYRDDDRTVIVINSHSESRGLGSRQISAIEIRKGIVSIHKIAAISYYATDGEFDDNCYDPSSRDKVRISTVGTIENIDVRDIDSDGYRDILVKVRYTDCKTKKEFSIFEEFRSK